MPLNSPRGEQLKTFAKIKEFIIIPQNIFEVDMYRVCYADFELYCVW